MLWQKNMVMLDANMILRYLLDDNPEMAEKAEEYRWTFLAYAESNHPFSEKLVKDRRMKYMRGYPVNFPAVKCFFCRK